MAPRVTGINPDGSLRVGLDDGREIPVAPGTVPELDDEARRFGGASASEPMALDLAGEARANRDAFFPQGGQQQPQTMADVPQGPPLPPRASPAAGPTGSQGPLTLGEEVARNRQAGAERAQRQATEAAPAEQSGGISVADLQAMQGPAAQGAGRNFAIVQQRGRGGGGPRQTQTAEMTREVRAPIDPIYGERIAQAQEEKEVAREQQALVELERAAQRTAIREQGANAIQAQQEAQQLAQRRYEENRALASQRVEAATKRYRNLAEDPFAERGAGARVIAAIASALGAFGAALTGGKNYAQENIQAQIDRELASARDAMREGSGRLADLRQGFADEQAALSAHEAGIRTRIADQLESIADNTADQSVAAQLQMEAATQREASALAAAQAAQAEAGVGTVSEQTQLRRGGGGGREQQMGVVELGRNEDGVMQYAKVPLNTVGDIEKFRELTGEDAMLVPHVPGLEVTDAQAAQRLRPEEVTKLRDIAGATTAVREQMSRLRQISEMPLPERRASPAVRDEVQAIRMNLVGELGRAVQAGALSEAEEGRMLAQIPDVDALIAAPERAQTIQGVFERTAQARMRVYGFGVEGIRRPSSLGEAVE